MHSASDFCTLIMHLPPPSILPLYWLDWGNKQWAPCGRSSWSRAEHGWWSDEVLGMDLFRR